MQPALCSATRTSPFGKISRRRGSTNCEWRRRESRRYPHYLLAERNDKWSISDDPAGLRCREVGWIKVEAAPDLVVDGKILGKRVMGSQWQNALRHDGRGGEHDRQGEACTVAGIIGRCFVSVSNR
jgi:hypothetical protein